jgi:hypothetical protein
LTVIVSLTSARGGRGRTPIGKTRCVDVGSRQLDKDVARRGSAWGKGRLARVRGERLWQGADRRSQGRRAADRTVGDVTLGQLVFLYGPDSRIDWRSSSEESRDGLRGDGRRRLFASLADSVILVMNGEVVPRAL